MVEIPAFPTYAGMSGDWNDGIGYLNLSLAGEVRDSAVRGHAVSIDTHSFNIIPFHLYPHVYSCPRTWCGVHTLFQTWTPHQIRGLVFVTREAIEKFNLQPPLSLSSQT